MTPPLAGDARAASIWYCSAYTDVARFLDLEAVYRRPNHQRGSAVQALLGGGGKLLDGGCCRWEGVGRRPDSSPVAPAAIGGGVKEEKRFITQVSVIEEHKEKAVGSFVPSVTQRD